MMVANKRAKGTGSVHYDKTDGRWRGSLPNPDKTQPRRPLRVSGKTEAEATQKLEALRAAHTPHVIYLPEQLSQDVAAKVQEQDTTLSGVVAPMLEEWVKE